MHWIIWIILQDFSKFLDDNFDTKEWVNSAFKSGKETSMSKDVSSHIENMKIMKQIKNNDTSENKLLEFSQLINYREFLVRWSINEFRQYLPSLFAAICYKSGCQVADVHTGE